ncbi:bifunctional diaminohydroxyphosphoribosylaminopyrimidine deaminase/5-amino-6-(5-phosphoribosylamino)uracil reductase RibD [Reinekea thalattae]|uniref:Riboflavin biosynthesis protein RibD n=1 Tax=Reinekea thalattae TaxID=2593301 RepID=A0A5C8ZBD6_9GAMM|nr:bifunctional diaminohydroxyphosphoribosylaminopyrimidine deaminase/5-amino-6-(5-phosphoribosylamino)uracil reductase RibD [Reinekea thalattae]TXR54473.1 bifunctional diaminohydroxyphosphoribosylaminopyrimidine deaminase/5-amino-6-(5-phosphoribosylamino)uracil reductase RibD [Reinekea thalattae]
MAAQTNEVDSIWMQRALQLAERGLYSTSPNPRVGCVIVDADQQVVGEGFHERAGEPHAEVNALRQAGNKAKGATAYVTLEPCSHFGRTPPCCQALIKAEVRRVVFAMQDPNSLVSGRGLQALKEAGIEVAGPVLEQQAYALNAGFIKRMTDNLPLVRTKSAMSLDARTAMASGESQWITGADARQDVQHWRARSCAIITGVDSVIQDDPKMTVRLADCQRQPIRIIVDSHGRTPAQAAIFDQPGQTIIATTEQAKLDVALIQRASDVWRLPEKDGRVDLHALQAQLAEQQCNEVLVEAGASLTGSYLMAGLVDEMVVYMAAKLLGSSARPLFQLPFERMSQAIDLTITQVEPVGSDWRIIATPNFK